MQNLSQIINKSSLNSINGKKITAIRNAENIKRADLARTADINLNALTAIERGVCDTSWGNIMNICAIYPKYTWWLLLDDLPFVTQLIPNQIPLAQQAKNALTLPQRIFYLRKYHLKISRKAFAKAINISYNVLLKIEDEQMPSLSKLQLLCKHYPQYTYWLVTGDKKGVQQAVLAL